MATNTNRQSTRGSAKDRQSTQPADLAAKRAVFPMVFLVQPVTEVMVVPPERLTEWEQTTMKLLRAQVQVIRDRAVALPSDPGDDVPNTGTCTETISGDPRRLDDPDYD